jgi:hypothetical protein
MLVVEDMSVVFSGALGIPLLIIGAEDDVVNTGVKVAGIEVSDNEDTIVDEPEKTVEDADRGRH